MLKLQYSNFRSMNERWKRKGRKRKVSRSVSTPVHSVRVGTFVTRVGPHPPCDSTFFGPKVLLVDLASIDISVCRWNDLIIHSFFI